MPRRTKEKSAQVLQAEATAAMLGAALGEVRTLRNLTMPQVQKITGGGIEASTLSRLEGGSRANPHIATIHMLAVAYDCDVTFKRDGTFKIAGTRLTELTAAVARTQLPKEGTK